MAKKPMTANLKNHSDVVLSKLKDMKEKGELCDIIIQSRNKSFKAHRNILAAGIPYFRSIFDIGTIESSQNIVIIDSVDPASLEILINFAYGNTKLNVAADTAFSLLEAAIYLRVDRVVKACFQYFAEQIDDDNVFAICKYAGVDAENGAVALRAVTLYLSEKFDKLWETEHFSNLPLAVLKGIISQNDLCVTSEQVVFDAVLKWTKAMQADRTSHLPELLSYVRLPLLKPEYVAQHISTEVLMQANTKYQSRLWGSGDVLNSDSSPLKERCSLPPRSPCSSASSCYRPTSPCIHPL